MVSLEFDDLVKPIASLSSINYRTTLQAATNLINIPHL